MGLAVVLDISVVLAALDFISWGLSLGRHSSSAFRFDHHEVIYDSGENAYTENAPNDTTGDGSRRGAGSSSTIARGCNWGIGGKLSGFCIRNGAGTCCGPCGRV
jgi:hypothetical protein